MKKRFLEYVLLAEDEHQKLVDFLGPELTTHWIEELDDYLGASERNRRKYDSHYRAIRIWAKRNPKPKTKDNGGADRFIRDLREHAVWPDMSPRDRELIYAVLREFNLPWPQLRKKLIEDPTMEQKIKDVYLAEAQSSQRKA